MHVIAPIPPAALKAVFEASGYTCVKDSPHHWFMARGSGPPFPIPKHGQVCSVPLMDKAFHAPDINHGALLDAAGSFELQPEP